mgnify:CR=1 FL=1
MDRRFFLQALGCGCLSLGISSCSTVPITDRKQLKLIPESRLNAQAARERWRTDRRRIAQARLRGGRAPVRVPYHRCRG